LYDYIISANTVKQVQKGKAFVFSIIDSDTPVMDGNEVAADASKYLDPSVRLIINNDTNNKVKEIDFRLYHPVENIDISIGNELLDSSLPPLHTYYSAKNNQYFPDEAIFEEPFENINEAPEKRFIISTTPNTNRFLHL
jgi:hypothetical protein